METGVSKYLRFLSVFLSSCTCLLCRALPLQCEEERTVLWPLWVGFRELSWGVSGCAHQAGTAALCEETACGSLPSIRAMQSLALGAVGLRAHPRAPGAAPLQEGLHWGVPGQALVSCTSVTSCTCSALPFSAWMQRMPWA